MLVNGHLVVFVATRAEDVPPGCARYISVDGSVPGYSLRWDHHVSGERINLEAMPETIDARGFDGVGTTLADADALASVVAVLLGGKSRLHPRARGQLESASFWCDHLRPHPELDAETNRLGRGLLDDIDQRLSEDRLSFGELCLEIAEKVAQGDALPFMDRWPEQIARARALVAAGRLQRRGAIAFLDLTGTPDVDPAATYAEHDCPVAVELKAHRDGGRRYTVGLHPYRSGTLDDLRPALAALAQAEFAHGPPALSPEPKPGAENWGGRARVFGSPWNYGSRLEPDSVLEIVARALDLPR